MSTTSLSLKLGIGTLRSRPTLTALAALLLALGTFILSVLFGLVFILQSLQTQLTTALTLELELIQETEEVRATVMSNAEAWPGIESVQYVAPDAILQEIEQETGEDLLKLFGTNPFPPIIRVRFGKVSLRTLDSLATVAKSWPDVANVAYPRTAWLGMDKLAARLQGKFGWGSAGLALLILILVGLCLRAQVRNRADTWDFLLLMGASPQTIRLSLLVQQLAVGLLGGLIACGMLAGLALFLHWLLLRPIEIPFWFHVCVVLSALLLSVLAGLLSPRKFGKR